MAVPSNRVPVRVARGLKSALDANVLSLYEGEIVYAKDEDKLYIIEGGVLVAMGANLAAASIGDLSDVTITSAAAGEVLRYNGSAWVDAGLTKADITDFVESDYATSAQGTLADSAVQPTDSIDTLADVDTTTSPPTSGQVLTWVAASSQWRPASVASGGLSGVGVATRATDSGTAASGALTLTGLGSSGLLHTIFTDLDAWVVFYGSAADRTADAGRGYGTDPTPGSGVLAEVYVTTAGAVLFTPGTMYMNNDITETSAIYLAVRDQVGAAVNATLTVSAYVQGGYTGVSGGTFGSG